MRCSKRVPRSVVEGVGSPCCGVVGGCGIGSGTISAHKGSDRAAPLMLAAAAHPDVGV